MVGCYPGEEEAAKAAEQVTAAVKSGVSLPVCLASGLVRYLHQIRGSVYAPVGGGVVSASFLNAKHAVGGIGVEPRRGDMLRVLFAVESDAVADAVVRNRCCLCGLGPSVAVFDVLSDREEARHQALWPAFLAAKAAGKRVQFHRARLVVDGARLFLSYRKADCSDVGGGDGTAPRLKVMLEGDGWSVFMDQSGLEVGDRWEDILTEKVDACTAFVAVISSTYEESHWCRAELEIAHNQGKLIIPLWHSGSYPPSKLRMRLNGIQSMPSLGSFNAASNLEAMAANITQSLKRKGFSPAQPGGASRAAPAEPVPPPPSVAPPAMREGFSPTQPVETSHVEPVERPQAAPGEVFDAVEKGDEAEVRPLLSRGAVEDDVGNTDAELPAHAVKAQPKAQPKAQQAQVPQRPKPAPGELIAAADSTDEAEVRSLLRRGANADEVNKNGWTPLYLAATCGYAGVATLLLAAKASVDKADNDGRTPLYGAAIYDHEGMVTQLLATKASVDKANNDGWTPLNKAAYSGHEGVVTLLLAAKASVDKANNSEQKPLMSAAREGREGVVTLLLAAKASVDKADNDGCTPLIWAAVYNHEGVVTCLLAAKASVDKANNDGDTPLIVAATYGREDVLTLLLAAKSSVDKAGNDGQTPLLFAAYNGHKGVVTRLLAAKASVDKTNNDGRTPLYGAAIYGHAGVVTLLLAAKASVDKADNDGITPLSAAKRDGHTAVVCLLEQHGARS
ncbi:hypothetical protein FOA52_006449 [Chlamydomonas sp. UWO 241]|nr:hypothetical protein FOA52_006449 [Chlamydomonas sp. UWO 241]